MLYQIWAKPPESIYFRGTQFTLTLKRENLRKTEKKWQKEHAKKFRYVMEELRWVDDLNWTWSLFPSHVVVLSQSNEVTVF